jgi:hypothetical protein
MRMLTILAFALALTACSNLKVQWSMSYMTDNLKADLEEAQRAEKGE